MKVAVVVPTTSQLESWGAWLALAFQELKQDTKQFSYREVADTSGVDGMNRQLLRVIKKWDSDLVVVVKGELVKPATLETLKNQGTTNVLLANDDHQVLEQVSVPLGRYCERVFTFTSMAIPRYAKEGIKAEFMLFYADPNICAPQDLPETHDVSFVGTYYPERERLVAAIASSSRLKLRLLGDGWAASIWYGGRPDYPEVLKTWNESKICLNIHQDGLKKLGVVANLRCYELGACGRFMVSDHVEGMEKVFGSPLPFFTLPDDWNLQEKCDQLKIWAGPTYAQTRLDKANALREIVLKNHTPRKRAEQILTALWPGEWRVSPR